MIELQPYQSSGGIAQQQNNTKTIITWVSVVIFWLATFFLLFPAIDQFINLESLQCVAFISVVLVLFAGTLGINAGVHWAWNNVVGVKVGDPIVRASSQTIERGQDLTVSYQQPVYQQTVLESFSVQLVRYEWVKWQSGTDTRTDQHRLLVAEERALESGIIKAGDTLEADVTFKIPDDAMHTVDKDHNKIRWFIVVKASLRAWPDFAEQYELILNPGGKRRTA